MNIIFYTSDKDVPFEELYQWIDGKSSKIFFSNTKNFNKEKRLIGASLPRPDNIAENEEYLFNEEYIFLVPKSWQDEFSALIYKLYDTELTKVPNTQKPAKEKIGSSWNDKLAQFYDENVETNVDVLRLIIKQENSKEEEKKNFSECFHNQVKLPMKQTLSALKDPMQIGIFAIMIMLGLSMILIHLLKGYTVINQVKLKKTIQYYESLPKEELAQAQGEEDNPALLMVITEMKKAQNWDNEQPLPKQSPLKRECYIIIKGDRFASLIKKFYNNIDNDKIQEFIINTIKDKSLREDKDGKKGIYNAETEKIDEIPIDEIPKEKKFNNNIQIGWELVIPDAQKGHELLKECQFSP